MVCFMDKYFRVKEPPVDRAFPENPQWVNDWIQGLFNRDWRAFKVNFLLVQLI
jgi:hypothetical protein